MQSEPMRGLLIYFTATRHTSKDEAHRTINEQWAHLSLVVGQSMGQGASSAWPRGARWPRLQHLDVRSCLARLL